MKAGNEWLTKERKSRNWGFNGNYETFLQKSSGMDRANIDFSGRACGYVYANAAA